MPYSGYVQSDRDGAIHSWLLARTAHANTQKHTHRLRHQIVQTMLTYIIVEDINALCVSKHSCSYDVCRCRLMLPYEHDITHMHTFFVCVIPPIRLMFTRTFPPFMQLSTSICHRNHAITQVRTTWMNEPLIVFHSAGVHWARVFVVVNKGNLFMWRQLCTCMVYSGKPLHSKVIKILACFVYRSRTE